MDCVGPGPYELHEGASNYHTLVGPTLCSFWRLQNTPYKVAHLLCLEVKQEVIVIAGRVLRIHSSHGSNLKAC